MAGISFPGHAKGLVYGRTKCQSCGFDVAIVADKNGAPYYMCQHLDDDLEPCATQHKIGRRAAAKIVAKYDDAKKKADADLNEARELKAKVENDFERSNERDDDRDNGGFEPDGERYDEEHDDDLFA